MPMFDDPNKELQKLQEQLLKEEEWFARELDSAKALIGETPAKKTRAAASRQQKPLDQTQVFRSDAPKAGAKTGGRKPAASGKPVVRNTEDGNVNLDDAPAKKNPSAAQKKKKKKKKSNKGLIILAGLETLGIVGVVAYWLIFLL